MRSRRPVRETGLSGTSAVPGPALWRARLGAWLRLGRLVWHLLVGVLTLLLPYRFAGPARRQAIVRNWSRRLLAICGMTLRVQGDVRDDEAALLVANHISWIDIFVIDGWRPTHFVAKAEIRHWPVIGWLADRVGTLFIERGKRSDAKRVVEVLAARIRDRQRVALFAEGTTSDGSTVLPFHASLFAAAGAAGAPVRPLAIRYEDEHGRPTDAPAFVGETTLYASVMALLLARPLTAWVAIGAPLPSEGLTRRALADATRRAIIALLPADAASEGSDLRAASADAGRARGDAT